MLPAPTPVPLAVAVRPLASPLPSVAEVLLATVKEPAPLTTKLLQSKLPLIVAAPETTALTPRITLEPLVLVRLLNVVVELPARFCAPPPLNSTVVAEAVRLGAPLLVQFPATLYVLAALSKPGSTALSIWTLKNL